MIKAVMFAAVLLSATAAQAQTGLPPQCGATEDMARIIYEKYGELVVADGKNLGEDSRVKLYANLDSGTFTIVVEQFDGKLSCMIGAGEELKFVEPVTPEEDDPDA